MAVLTPEAPKAATLDGQDVVHAGLAEIVKWEEGPDGTLYVYGRGTTPEVDTDEQIVDSGWSGDALKQWLTEAPALRVQHNGQRDPAGSGVRVDVNRDGDGAHWIKAAVDEPVAQRLVKKRHLRAFSVGIARPVIERDTTGKARGGVIKGGRIVEVSLVDSPANRSCFLEIAKAAGDDGHAEFTGKVFAPDDVLTKDAAPAQAKRPKTVDVTLPANMSLSIKPSDLAKLANFKRGLEAQRQRPVLPVAEALKAAGREPRPEEEALLAKAAAGSALQMTPAEVDALPVETLELSKRVLRDSEREGMPAGDFAYVDSQGGKHLPVQDEGHVRSALGRFAQQEFESPAARKKAARKIVSRARSMGLDLSEHGTVVAAAGGGKTKVAKAAEPQVTKCGTCGGNGMADGKPCPDCKAGKKAAKRDKALLGGLAALNDLAGAKTQADALAALHGVEAAVAPITKKKGKLRAVCPGCGAKQNPAHRHCPECGRELPASALMTVKNHDHICLGCGKELDKGERFCPDCGRENPGYLPEADRKIPSNQDADKAAGKGRVAKGRKNSGKPRGKTPAGASGAVSAPEKPVGPHREPDGAEVDALEADMHASDGDSEQPTHLEAHTLAGAPGRARKSAKGKAKGKKAGKGKKVPPWMKDSDGDDDGDAQKSAAPSDDPELLAALRLRQLGVPGHMGAAHDLTCPAFLPAEVDACYPGASLKSLDLGTWQEDVLTKAATAGLEEAQGLAALLDATMTLRAADPLDLQDIREGAHKMFRDAQQGPGSFPTPTQIGPAAFHRPYLSEGHAAPSPGHDAPNHATIPPVGGIQPGDYRRGYISEGHADDSPGNTHPAPPAPAPDRTGTPTTSTSRVFYRNSMREGDEHAMRVLHDHISARFPALCPMHPHFADKPVPVPQGAPAVSPIPGTAGLGSKKDGRPAMTKAERKAKRAEKAARAAKRRAARARKAATARDLKDARRLIKTARAGGERTPSQIRDIQDALNRLTKGSGDKIVLLPPGAAAPLPEGVKTVEGAPEPPVATPVSEAALAAALSKATRPLLKKVAAQDRALKRLRKTADAIAGQPDTTGAPFRGVALPKSSGASPAGQPGFAAKSAEQMAAERYAALEHEFYTTTNPDTQAALGRALATYWNPAMANPQAPPPA